MRREGGSLKLEKRPGSNQQPNNLNQEWFSATQPRPGDRTVGKIEIEENQKQNPWSFVPQNEIGTEGGDLGIKAKVNISENADGAKAA